MDLHPEQLLEILNQPGMIQQTPAWFPCDQQIEAAVLVGFTTGHGTEHAHIVGAAPLGEQEHLFPPFHTQGVQGDHAREFI